MVGINRELLRPQPAEIGFVKVGCKGGQARTSRGGRTYYQAQKFENDNGPFFVVTKTVRGKDGAENFVVDHDLMKKLSKYNDKDGKLRQIPIAFRSDLIDEVAITRFNKYDGNKLFCSGTGHGENNATRIVNNERTKVTCPCSYLQSTGDDRCKPNILLHFTIMAGEETKIGVSHAFRSTGWDTIKATLGGLEESIRVVGGLTPVQHWLCCKWKHKRDRTGVTRRVIVVYVESRVRDMDHLVELQRVALERRRVKLAVIQTGAPERLGLPAPGDETVAQQAEVAAEWYPRSEVDAAEGAELERDDDDEVIEYDPETGEVPASAQQSQGTPSPVTEKDEPGSRKNPFLPKADKLMAKIAERLTDLAEARGFERRDVDGFKAALKDVLMQVTTDYCGEPLTFSQLTRKRAEQVLGGIDLEFANAAERAACEGEGEIDVEGEIAELDEEALLTHDNPAEG